MDQNKPTGPLRWLARWAVPALSWTLLCFAFVRGPFLIHSFANEYYTVATIQKLDADQEQEQATVLNNATEYAKAQGLKISDSVQAYGAIANERQVDMIAMGTHGMGVIGSMLLGSVAQKVIHLSVVPVMLVK